MIYKIYTFQYETNQFLYGLGKGISNINGGGGVFYREFTKSLIIRVFDDFSLFAPFLKRSLTN